MILKTSFDELNDIISQKTPVKGLSLSYTTSCRNPDERSETHGTEADHTPSAPRIHPVTRRPPEIVTLPGFRASHVTPESSEPSARGSSIR